MIILQLYVIFGECTNKLCAYLNNNYNVIGSERTIEAAIDSIKQTPDIFLILGTALASILVDDRLNWGLALVHQLTRLRKQCSSSRIIVILPESSDTRVITEIYHLGIYDIHQVDSVKVKDLSGYIDNPKTFADIDSDKTSSISDSARPDGTKLQNEESKKEGTRFPLSLPKMPKLDISNIRLPRWFERKDRGCEKNDKPIQQPAVSLEPRKPVLKTLAIAFGDQSQFIAKELDGKYEVTCKVATVEQIDIKADRFLVIGKHTDEFVKVIKKLHKKNPHSNIVVVYAVKPKVSLPGVKITVSKKFDSHTMECWLENKEPPSPIKKQVPAVQTKQFTKKVIVVWSPVEQYIVNTAKELAVAWPQDITLVNFDFESPGLDLKFGLDLKDCSLQNTGLLTMGDQFTLDLLPSLLRKKGNVSYLPAGYGFGAPGPPHTVLENIISTLSKGMVIVSPGVRYDAVSTMTALANAGAILVPFSTGQELEIAKQRLSELAQKGVVDVNRIVELLWSSAEKPGQVFRHRISDDQWQNVVGQLHQIKI